MKNFFILLIVMALISCASVTPEITRAGKTEAGIVVKDTVPEIPIPEMKAPEFVPVKESSSPLSTRTVSVSARNTPLRDVLFTIAQTANLNLVLDRGVNPEHPVTMNFKELPVENALNIVINSSDYFYTVKNNILTVTALRTEIFELGQPGVIQQYKLSVGGDILSGTSSGSSGAIKGDVTMSSASDTGSFDFWASMEKTLSTLLSEESARGGSELKASFIVNRMTGTIMVTATKNILTKVGDYISNLKNVLNRQVMIEARIVEVQLNDSLKYGIDWQVIGKWLGGGGRQLLLGTNNFTDVVSTDSPSFEVAIFGTNNLTVLLEALQEQGDVKTLSNPRVNIMNGQTSMLSVGRNTTFVSSVETSTDNTAGATPVTTFTVNTSSVLSGVIFGLVPYIHDNGEVTISITPIVTNLVQLEAKTIGTGGDSLEIKLPTVDLREMSTTVKILDGQLIVIGGLIDKKEILREKKIPILSDIPIIGKAFKSVEKSLENTELIILLIPRIVS